jgi:small membrane protein
MISELPQSPLSEPPLSTGLSGFQILALAFLAVNLLLDVRREFKGMGHRGLRWFRILIWLTAGFAIWRPDSVTQLAHLLGIGRGADVVLYVFVLAFLATSFYWYSQHVIIQRQLTEIVRHLALKEARQGGEDAGIKEG